MPLWYRSDTRSLGLMQTAEAGKLDLRLMLYQHVSSSLPWGVLLVMGLKAAYGAVERWDRTVIRALVAHMEANGHTGLGVDTWPEDDKHAASPIDAVAGRFAIEHTSIDTLEGQREADVPFMKSIGCLDKQVLVPFNLTILVGWGAIKKGQDYAATCEAVKRWIVEDSPHLSWGRHEIDDVPGVPFALLVRKADNLDAGVFIGRSVGSDDTLSERIRAAIEHKAKKLAAWSNHSRVLLIESDDIALMNHVVFWEALQRAYPEGLPYGVDEIWYADTCGKWHNSPPCFMRMTNDLGVLPVEALP